jgi:hypothetical protein
MKLFSIFLVFVAAFCCSVLPGNGAEILENKSISTIEPGTGIGNIRIGDDLADVVKKMVKKPSDGKTVRSGVLTEYWVGYTDMGITYIFNEKRILTRIATTNPGIVVQQKGIRVGSSTKDIERAYGPGRVRKIDDKYEQWIYENRGINFTINRNTEKIEAIMIERSR